ncbi:MAG: hypothetical protein ACFFD1_16330 [Candidatus Thorarchaeota archaeon]
MSSNIKVFKLTYSGKFTELSADTELHYFNLFDIIAVYVTNQKRMYVWIARKAAQSLKNHIPQIRQIFSKEYPELIILRNITIDEGFEPPEFFELMNFTRDELLQHLKNIETNLLPIILEINRLKNDVDQYFISEEYEKAIFQAKKIMQIAQKIEDESLERDQRDFIQEAQIKVKAKEKLKEIEEECKIVIDEFEKLIKSEDYQGAHNLVGNFKSKYDKEYNLNTIPLARQIILMDDNLGESINKETNRIKDQLIGLYNRVDMCLAQENLGVLPGIFNQANDLIELIDEPDINYSWQLAKDQFRKKKNALKKEIIEMNQKANTMVKQKQISDAKPIFETIISRLKNAFEE